MFRLTVSMCSHSFSLLLKILEKVGKVQVVPVKILQLRLDAFEEKRTTKTNGGLPVCHQNRYLYQELMRIVRPRIQTAGGDKDRSNLSSGLIYW